MSIPTIIALAAVAAFFLFIAGVMIARRLLGTLTISAEDGPFSAGDVIETQLVVEASRSLSWGAVTMALRCLDLDDHGGSQPYHEIYRDEHVLSGPGTLAAGGSQTFVVSIPIPTELEPHGLAFELPKVAGELLEPLMEAAVDRRRMDIRWELVAEVTTEPIAMNDTLGLDLDLLP